MKKMIIRMTRQKTQLRSVPPVEIGELDGLVDGLDGLEGNPASVRFGKADLA